MKRKELSREDKIKKYKIPLTRGNEIVLLDDEATMKPEVLIETLSKYIQSSPNSYLVLNTWTSSSGWSADDSDIAHAELKFIGSVPYSDEEIDQLISNREKELAYQKGYKKREKERRLKENDKMWRQLCKERGIKLDNNGKVLNYNSAQP